MPDEYIATAAKGEHFLDDPGAAILKYTATGSGPGTIEAIAGAPDGNRPGDQAEVYFPHLGGIYDYFLKDMQTMLQPYGLGANAGFAAPTLPVGVGDTSNLNIAACTLGSNPSCSQNGGYNLPVCPASCNNANPDGSGRCLCAVENLLPHFGNDINAATIASHMCLRESGGNPKAQNLNCNLVPGSTTATGSTLDYSIGLFQINMIAACPNTFTSYSYGPPPYCRMVDSPSGIQTRLDNLTACVNDYLDPNNNIDHAANFTNNGTDWQYWHAPGDNCGQQSTLATPAPTP